MYVCTKNKMYSDPNVRQFESSSTILSSETCRRSLERRAQPWEVWVEHRANKIFLFIPVLQHPQAGNKFRSSFW